MLNNEPLPSFKILRPELQSGKSKLQQMTQNQIAKLFQKNYQEQMEKQMEGYERRRKTEAVSMSGSNSQRVEDMFRDFDKSNQNLRYERGNNSGDSEMLRLSEADR
jgi:GTPase involved in cell partitioning and DNA repair